MRPTRLVMLALAALLTCAGVAFAAVGLTNPSFEEDLTGWTANTVREAVYEQDQEIVGPDCSTPDAARRSVCVVTSDTFTVGETVHSVNPIDGTKMARLGGPFTSADEAQALDRYHLRQTFTVDPANPVLKLNYNVFTFDYSGYDELRFNVSLVDENGAQIANFVQGAFGEGTTLKSTGWQAGYIDLTGYENQQVHLLIDSGGTSDHLFGFWAYVDAGEVPTAPVSAPELTVPDGVDVNFFGDENTGQTWITIPNSVVNGDQFNGCLPIDISLPIDPGAGTVSDVTLLLNGTPYPMTDEDADGSWTTHIDCVEDGQLLVQYTLTEEGVSQTFLIPIGGITLIDPAGVVYDQEKYDAAVAAGSTPDQARATAAIAGAKVRLQRNIDGIWNNVLSGDPNISPKVNPETTAADGRYAWDVAAGQWRVVVSADGYVTTTSAAVTVPPPVLDLHVGLAKATTPQPPDDDGDGVPNASDKCPNQSGPGTPDGCAVPTTPPPPQAPAPAPAPATPAPASPVAGQKTGPCTGLTGTKLAACNRAQALAKKVARCKKIKNRGKRAVCIKKARALSKCQAIKAKKKRARCVAKARKIGAKKRR